MFHPSTKLYPKPNGATKATSLYSRMVWNDHYPLETTIQHLAQPHPRLTCTFRIIGGSETRMSSLTQSCYAPSLPSLLRGTCCTYQFVGGMPCKAGRKGTKSWPTSLTSTRTRWIEMLHHLVCFATLRRKANPTSTTSLLFGLRGSIFFNVPMTKV